MGNELQDSKCEILADENTKLNLIVDMQVGLNAYLRYLLKASFHVHLCFEINC